MFCVILPTKNNFQLTKCSGYNVHFVVQTVPVRNTATSRSVQPHSVHFVHERDRPVFLGNVAQLL